MMARSTRKTTSAAGAALRQAHADRLRYLRDGFAPNASRTWLADLDARIAEVESGAELVLDSGTLFLAMHRLSPRAAARYNYRSDPESRRRFRLTSDNRLSELTP